MSAERHVIFGTAGHVDHGKSALVLALTGTDPDRLAEEKAREMTIDLGFAFLSLPGIENQVAIVDVPGHEMFVRNMVAGATGVDAAIFVVAADEGVMPQSVEHLDVLRFLGLSDGVVALTKSDKATPGQIDQASAEVRKLVHGTFLEKARIMPVSAITGDGLPAFNQELAHIAARVQARSSKDTFRLPIDRVFTLKGVGTVITGTVISGSLAAGETVTCLPQERDLRARSLQVHDKSVKRIFAGQRAAINLAGVAKDDLHRGNVLATPGALAPSFMVDARLHLSATAPRPIRQRTRVRVHHETREVMARVTLLESDLLKPGESQLIQLRLESPLVPATGDLFVLRSYSPTLVIGGGLIVDPHPPKRKQSGGSIAVAKREHSSAPERLIDALDRAGAEGEKFESLCVLATSSAQVLRTVLEQMQADLQVYAGSGDRWYSAAAIADMQASILAGLAGQHKAEPWFAFVPLNKLTASAAAAPAQRNCLRLALAALKNDGAVVIHAERVRLASHAPHWAGADALARDTILATCMDKGLATPRVEELSAAAEISEKQCRRILAALADAGDLRCLAQEIYVHTQVFDASRTKVREFLEQHGSLNIGQCRDLLNASRKYLLPFLEELDRQGLTVRQGNDRVLRKA